MVMIWSNASVFDAFAGGAIIGVAAAGLMLINGRIAGISGIIGGLLQRKPDAYGWRVAFITGLIFAPLVWACFAPLPLAVLSQSSIGLALAGLLVGFGSRLGSGCTSGHGVCGLSRFSIRSLVATACFMASAMLTVFIAHILR